MKIKICGLNPARDVQLCIDLKVNYLGFVFYKKSPRNICLSDIKILSSYDKKNSILTIDNVEYNIPFILFSKETTNINFKDIYDGLSFTRKLMENKFFVPNNIKFPLSRKIFENKFLELN